MGLPSRPVRTDPPCSRVPAPLASAPGVQSAGRPEEHSAQEPQLGTKVRTTWSPTRTCFTPGPIPSTTPAASCPSAMGSGRTRDPSTTEMSEWQTPAASMRTRISPARGPASSTSSSCMGRDSV